jgi:hypothetical protein
MADPPLYPEADTGDDTGVGRGPGSKPGMPRWVKISLIIVIVLVLAFVILRLAGVGGEHGPRRHSGGSNALGGHTPLAWVSPHP